MHLVLSRGIKAKSAILFLKCQMGLTLACSLYRKGSGKCLQFPGASCISRWKGFGSNAAGSKFSLNVRIVTGKRTD